MTNLVPQGYGTVTPTVILTDCAKAIDLYKAAFGAEQLDRLDYPDGSGVMHATIKISNSIIMMGDETPNMPAKGASFYLYVSDADQALVKATKAGLIQTMPAEDYVLGRPSGRGKGSIRP